MGHYMDTNDHYATFAYFQSNKRKFGVSQFYHFDSWPSLNFANLQWTAVSSWIMHYFHLQPGDHN